MKIKDYEGTTLEVINGDRRLRIRMGYFFPANAKDVKRAIETICDIEWDTDTRINYIDTICRWLDHTVSEMDTARNEIALREFEYRNKGLSNNTYEKIAESRKKDAEYLEKQIEKYKKCKSQVLAAAEKCGVDIGEVSGCQN